MFISFFVCLLKLHCISALLCYDPIPCPYRYRCSTTTCTLDLLQPVASQRWVYSHVQHQYFRRLTYHKDIRYTHSLKPLLYSGACMSVAFCPPGLIRSQCAYCPVLFCIRFCRCINIVAEPWHLFPFLSSLVFKIVPLLEYLCSVLDK